MALSSFCPVCGAENEPGDALCRACQQPLAEGSDLGQTYLLNERYEVLTEVGAGGFGAVYKARDTQDADQARLVAVKQINLKGLAAQEVIEATNAFNREAEILSTLRHSMLPRISDRFSDAEHWYLVMNFIDGQTLDDYLEQRKTGARSSGLALSETLEIALHLCDVLRYLHTQEPPVIFRDLKPGNIMRTARGRLYLIDFGIARRFKPGQARDTIPFGSPGFAAPEQYGKAQTTPRADIYSLGALLYCLISGDDPSEHPFHFPRLRLYGVAGLPELDALIQRMVEPAPEQRPADIQEVRAKLQLIQRQHNQVHQKQRIWIPPQGQTPGAFVGQQHIFQPPSATPARKTTRRRVLTVGLLAAGAAVLVGGGAGLAMGFPGAASQQVFGGGKSNLDPEYTATDQASDATATAIAQNAVVPLDGTAFWSRDMAYAAVANRRTNQVEIYSVDNKQKLQAMKSSTGLSAYFVSWAQWSADNRRLLLISHDGMVGAWDTKSGQILFTYINATRTSMYSYLDQPPVALSPDGQYCAMSYLDGNAQQTFVVLRVTDGRQLFLSHSADYVSDSMAWSSDSKFLAFAKMNNPNADFNNWPCSTSIWDRETYQVVSTFRGSIATNYPVYSNTLLYIAWSPSNEKLAFVNQTTVWLKDLVTGRNTFLEPDAAAHSYIFTSEPILSPNEKYLAILVDGALIIWDIARQTEVQPVGAGDHVYFTAFSWSPDSRSITAVDDKNVISSWGVA